MDRAPVDTSSQEAHWQRMNWSKVALGTWLYDGLIAKPIAVWAKPAKYSSTRYNEDDQLDEAKPIPHTIDGFLYCPSPGRGEFLTITDAMASADCEPWGPVKWLHVLGTA